MSLQGTNRLQDKLVSTTPLICPELCNWVHFCSIHISFWSGGLDSNLSATTVERVRVEEAVAEMHNYPEGETEAWRDVATNPERHN